MHFKTSTLRLRRVLEEMDFWLNVYRICEAQTKGAYIEHL